MKLSSQMDKTLIHYYEGCWETEYELGYLRDLLNRDLFLNIYRKPGFNELSSDVLNHELCELCVSDYDMKEGE